MSTRSSDTTARDELVRFLGSHEGRTFWRTAASLCSPNGSMGAEAPAGEPVVGIYRPVGAKVYERDPERVDEWAQWADVPRIEVRDDEVRVVLIGESAARGYFYDPDVSFAALIGEALRSVAPATPWSVVDLARTNAGEYDVGKLLVEVLNLRPAHIVFFAGNNWNDAAFNPIERLRCAGALARSGIAGRIEAVHRTLGGVASEMISMLAMVAGLAGSEAVVVVPEFNLVDWREESRFLVPSPIAMPAREWCRTFAAAEDALLAGRYPEAAELIRTLAAATEWEYGPVVHMRARVLEATEGFDAARPLYERARDLATGSCIPHSPRCVASVQRELVSSAAQYGFATVDLREVLREAGRPDNELFMDYCHLSRPGLQRAAGAVASRITGRAVARGWSSNQISERTESRAHALAAIHNAHYLQPADTVRRHIVRALAHEAGRETLALYRRSVADHAPRWLTGCGRELVQPRAVERYLRPLDSRLSARLSDTLLLREIEAALGTPRPSAFAAPLEPGTRIKNLLDPRYYAECFRERNAFGRKGRLFLRVISPVTRFRFDAEAPLRCTLELIARTPLDPNGACTVALDGMPLGETPLGTGWGTASWPIDVDEGAHVISIAWLGDPSTASPSREALADAEILGTYPEPFVVFADLRRVRLNCGGDAK